MAACKGMFVALQPMLLTVDSTTLVIIPAGVWRRTGALSAGRTNTVEIVNRARCPGDRVMLPSAASSRAC